MGSLPLEQEMAKTRLGLGELEKGAVKEMAGVDGSVLLSRIQISCKITINMAAYNQVKLHSYVIVLLVATTPIHKIQW